MTDLAAKGFLRYFSPLLDALRSANPKPLRPAEACAWIRSHIAVPAEDLARFIANGKQSIFENQVHWARFYLVQAKLVTSPKRGLWGLSEEGKSTNLTPDDTWALYVRIRDANRPLSKIDEEKAAAPDSGVEAEDGIAYWFVGAAWGGTDDQLSRFLVEGIWENGSNDKFLDLVRQMKAGDRIAVKANLVKKHGLPFDVAGKSVSAMRIKATGTITDNLKDGKRVNVDWDPPFESRDWYFYTYRTTVSKVNPEAEDGRRLIDFTFHGSPQDYKWFLAQPYWLRKYETDLPASNNQKTFELPDAREEESQTNEDEQSYTIEDIINDGCFLRAEELATILNRWRTKKNLVLQGPPGTGKTWLAKRLGYAMVGSDDRETTQSRLRVVQFHPALSYEDFVRGWRPSGEGRLALVDGIMMEAIDAAASEPDRPFVLVIEEINRGNPAQIFGEMLTLLEDSKRRPTEALELAYHRKAGERVFVPENLYVIGTMNVADRSLAIVDLALRRRFAFIDLEPVFGAPWRAWCRERGFDDGLLSQIESRISALNVEISSAASLGPQFRIGHSYVTPNESIQDALGWFVAKVETEICPLLDEYWYDAPEKSKDARTKLLDRLV